VNGWEGYSRLWAQILRETARPPQNRNMDLRVAPAGDDLRIQVDLLADAGTRLNNADVEAEVYFVPANSLGAGLKKVAGIRLEQRGPGAYRGDLPAGRSGSVSGAARSGSSQVSAGHIHQPAAEVATGQANKDLLERTAKLTGGRLLESPKEELVLEGSGVARHVELWPHLLCAFFALFLVDVVVRRWENALGMFEFLTGKPAQGMTVTAPLPYRNSAARR